MICIFVYVPARVLGARCAANSMYVVLECHRHGEVDDGLDVGNVETARSQVGCHHHAQLVFLELVELVETLRNVT